MDGVATVAARQQYAHQHNKQIGTPALAQMLSNTLYYKRFFPYYTFNILGGLDEQGPPCERPCACMCASCMPACVPLCACVCASVCVRVCANAPSGRHRTRRCVPL
jgi:hypothetical protein